MILVYREGGQWPLARPAKQVAPVLCLPGFVPVFVLPTCIPYCLTDSGLISFWNAIYFLISSLRGEITQKILDMIEKMLMAVLISFLLLCAGMGAVVLVYLWLIWYVALHERLNRRQRPLEDHGKPQKQQGLSADDLQRLPTIECGKEEEGKERSSGNAECVVCLEVFQSGDRCRVIPACSHAFHVQCADPWLSQCSFCPICRRSAASENGLTGGSAALLQEESGGSNAPPPVESIVVDIPIAIPATESRG